MISLENIQFSYGTEEKPVLTDVNLTVGEGECIVLCGKSGCGKSTILNLINGIIPNHVEGRLAGKVTVAGVEPKNVSIQELSATVGSVFQNPKSQFFSLNSSDELLFGCCNHKVPRDVMLERLAETADRFNMRHLLDKNIFNLSCGEKQKLTCASVYMNRPSVYVFDEPSANLDAEAIAELKKVIQTLKAAGNTILVAEHRLYYLTEVADRFVYLDDGQIVAEFSQAEFGDISDEERQRLGLRMIAEPMIESHLWEQGVGESALEIESLRCSYGSKLAVSIDNLRLPKNKVIALVGQNGAGKSTFVAGLCGILKSKGQVVGDKPLAPKERLKRSFMVMQDVNHQLFAESVLDELMLGFTFDDEEKIKAAEELLESLNLLPYKDQHPQSLSGGQKQRTAIATALFTGKRYLIFDEPTSGVDLLHMNRIAELIHGIKEQVDLILVITHDREFINSCCEYLIELKDGQVVQRKMDDSVMLS